MSPMAVRLGNVHWEEHLQRRGPGWGNGFQERLLRGLGDVRQLVLDGELRQ
jgi:hypothetical protein